MYDHGRFFTTDVWKEQFLDAFNTLAVRCRVKRHVSLPNSKTWNKTVSMIITLHCLSNKMDSHFTNKNWGLLLIRWSHIITVKVFYVYLPVSPWELPALYLQLYVKVLASIDVHFYLVCLFISLPSVIIVYFLFSRSRKIWNDPNTFIVILIAEAAPNLVKVC